MSSRHANPPERSSSSPFWTKLTDKQLLAFRIRDLGLRIEGTALERRVRRLFSELDASGIPFHPTCYLADEWLCPEGEPSIGIPFYLAHRRLIQLERKMMLEVEGGTEASCMRLLRHETGHALDHVYRFSRRPLWRRHFGNPSEPYTPSNYSSQPYSKRFVVHLEDNYAQAHPDEDFAETFAVWLDPSGFWEHEYRGWPVLEKLRYVDALMKEIRTRPPRQVSPQTPWAASRMRLTLGTYYDRKRSQLGQSFPGYFDPGLKRIFEVDQSGLETEWAAGFIASHRRHIISSAAMWSQRRKFDIDKLLRKLIARAQALRLVVRRPHDETLCQVTGLVTAVMCNPRTVKGLLHHV